MFKIEKKTMVEEQYLRELSSSLIIFQINSSLTNKTIQLLNTHKNNKINKSNI